MPSITQVTQRRAVTVLELDGDVAITIEYYPDRMSPAMMRQFMLFSALFDEGAMKRLTAEIETEADVENKLLSRLDGLAELLAQLIASWDLTEEDERTMVALTKERLVQLGLPLLMAVTAQIMRA